MSDAPSPTQEHLTPEIYFGSKGGKAWRIAMEAAHALARATDCPLGYDVTLWLQEKTSEVSEAMGRDRMKASRKDGASQQIPPSNG